LHFALFVEAEPINHVEALNQELWKKAMAEELAANEKSQTWFLTELLVNKKPIDIKWVFKLKLNPNGTISKRKARLVARGFLQKHGLDYSEVFAPVARIETIRLMVALPSSKGWPMFQLDVKSTFLHGPLEEV